VPDILIRGVDAKVVARLKKQAKANGRSLQAEAKRLLEQGAGPEKMDMESARKLAEEIRKSLAGRKFIDSTLLIRRDRNR
jgi:antitoxin FitA